MAINLSAQSALDLPLRGSAGSFKIGAGDEQNSLEVKYFLTHVGLNFGSGNDEKLLKELAPVREIFDFKQLDFDEIMQRDIDDARVSSELVPYILDDKTKDLIKFFPPIVVMVLPVEADRNKPAGRYSKVETYDETLNESGVENWRLTRSGKVGAEVFQFKQPIISDQPSQHDLVEFAVNTSKCRLIIVDGQHRAMALLALYRNLKDQWSDAKRKPFESYYAEWTPDYIDSFNLTDIHLPMIICTIPSLDTEYQGDYDLKKACRSIFLTLNKNARPVSKSRNLLLDDSDLISSFMRKTLSRIKNGDRDIRTDHFLEIHNIELDQVGDKQKISSPIAFTGVSHLYYIIEHILMAPNNAIKGVYPRVGRFSTRTSRDRFQVAVDKLDGLNVLGHDTYSQIKRDVFGANDETILCRQYDLKFGIYIFKALAKFSIFNCHSHASFNLKDLLGQNQDVMLRPMLFDGQGISRVFESHLTKLQKKLKDGDFKKDVPKIIEVEKQLKATRGKLEEAVIEFHKIRTKKLFDGLPKQEIFDGQGNIKKELLKWSKELYDNIFATVAFQAALICGFFTEYEKYTDNQEQIDEGRCEKDFDEYLKQIGEFFKPTTLPKLRMLLSVLKGQTTGDHVDKFQIREGSSDSFRAVVYPGEMQPDQWPKYKYLMTEIWKPSNEELANQLAKERKLCRKQVFKALHSRMKDEYLNSNRLMEEELTADKSKAIVEDAFKNYKDFLRFLGRASELNEADLH